jgi:hypothetical protein
MLLLRTGYMHQMSHSQSRHKHQQLNQLNSLVRHLVHMCAAACHHLQNKKAGYRRQCTNLYTYPYVLWSAYLYVLAGAPANSSATFGPCLALGCCAAGLGCCCCSVCCCQLTDLRKLCLRG